MPKHRSRTGIETTHPRSFEWSLLGLFFEKDSLAAGFGKPPLTKLYLYERPTPVYGFVEDVDILGDVHQGQPGLMRPENGEFELLKWRATILRQLFPSAEMRCLIYDPSDFYQGKGLPEHSN